MEMEPLAMTRVRGERGGRKRIDGEDGEEAYSGIMGGAWGGTVTGEFSYFC